MAELKPCLPVPRRHPPEGMTDAQHMTLGAAWLSFLRRTNPELVVSLGSGENAAQSLVEVTRLEEQCAVAV